MSDNFLAIDTGGLVFRAIAVLRRRSLRLRRSCLFCFLSFCSGFPVCNASGTPGRVRHRRGGCFRGYVAGAVISRMQRDPLS